MKLFSLPPTMPLRFLPILFVAILHDVAGLQQDGQAGYIQQQQQQQQRVPVLYEAYYPEPRDLSAQTRLQEIDKLRELTSELLEQEERLKQLASEITPEEENVFAPRSQVLEYVFSRPVIPLNERVQQLPTKNIEDVGIASLTVSDEPKHKIRHHHGDWLLRRIASNNQLRDNNNNNNN